MARRTGAGASRDGDGDGDGDDDGDDGNDLAFVPATGATPRATAWLDAVNGIDRERLLRPSGFIPHMICRASSFTLIGRF